MPSSIGGRKGKGMLVDSDEEGISFDLDPSDADDLAVHLSKVKATGNESKVVKFFRTKLFNFCNPRPEFHRKMAEERNGK
jgi:hypothetical protein